MYDKNLTILHVAPITSDKISGLTLAIPSTVEALHKIGIQTGILTTSSSGPYKKEAPYPVIYYRNGLTKKLTYKDLPGLLAKPDLIEFHSTYIPAHYFLAVEAKRKGIPYIITPHGGMTIKAQHKKRWKKVMGNILFFNKMVRNAAAIHCLTEQEACDVRSWNRPVFVIGNGVKLPDRDLMAKPGKKNGLSFVFLGRLDIYHKGLDLLLNACAFCKNELKKTNTKIILYGPDVNGSKDIIMRMIASLELNNIVEVHKPVTGLEKSKAFSNADVFLHTSRFEGHPMAVLEALSYGLPCILTPGTNISVEVEMAGAGWEAQPNQESIATCIKDIIYNRSKLAAMGINARNLAEREYQWEGIAIKLLHRYRSILFEKKNCLQQQSN